MAKVNLEDYSGVAPYRKKKEKVTPKKSDHKHIFKPFIGVSNLFSEHDHYVIAEECEICKKQRITKYFITAKVEGKPYSRMVSTLEEIKEIYPNYEVKRMEERS